MLPDLDIVLDLPTILADGTRVYTIPPIEDNAKKEAQAQANREAAEVGAAVPPVDVSTTGSSAGHVPQPATTAPTDWSQNPYAQVEGGFLGGLALGFVPFGAVGHQLLDAAEVLDHGSPEARRGLAVGQIMGGIVTLVGGITGEVLGGVASVTGIGAALGVPAIVVSSGLVVGGAGNIAAGIRGLLTTGSGSTGPQGAAPAAPAGRAGVNSGETAVTAAGRAAHKAWQPPAGFQKEFRLPSGRRADAANPTTREVIELKPNNPRAIREGQRQVERYAKELEEITGQKWTGRVETY